MVKIKKNTKAKPVKAAGKSGNAGKVLGLSVLLLLAGGGAAVYLNPELLEEVSMAVGLTEEPVPTETVSVQTDAAEAEVSAVSEPHQPPVAVFEAEPDAVAALGSAKLWVEARLAKGHTLLDINESLNVDGKDRPHWQSIQINQGTISAVHANSTPDNPTILLPMQDGDKITWVCAGAVPEALEEMCR